MSEIEGQADVIQQKADISYPAFEMAGDISVSGFWVGWMLEGE